MRRTSKASRQRRFDSPRLAVCRWTEPNAGDEAVQAGIASLFDSGTTWVHIGLFAPTDDAVEAVQECDGLVLGGGTILGNLPTWLTRPGVLDAIADTPFCIFGSGVRDEGKQRLEPEFVDAVQAMIHRGSPAGVRGDLGYSYLEESGIDVTNLSVIGDPALSLEAERSTRDTTGIAINVRPRPGGNEADTIALIRQFVNSPFARQFGPITFFSCHDEWDLRAEDALGVPIQPYSDLDALLQLLRSSALVISERLHGSVLAHLVGTPTVLLAYERKCLDYMNSMNSAQHCLENRNLDALEAACERALSDDGRSIAETIDRYRLLQQAHARTFETQFASP